MTPFMLVSAGLYLAGAILMRDLARKSCWIAGRSRPKAVPLAMCMAVWPLLALAQPITRWSQRRREAS